jgi:hypothetical protein
MILVETRDGAKVDAPEGQKNAKFSRRHLATLVDNKTLYFDCKFIKRAVLLLPTPTLHKTMPTTLGAANCKKNMAGSHIFSHWVGFLIRLRVDCFGCAFLSERLPVCTCYLFAPCCIYQFVSTSARNVFVFVYFYCPHYAVCILSPCTKIKFCFHRL